MERFRQSVYKNQHKLKYFFLVLAALSCFNCLAKPDYNLVLYTYAYFIWNMMSDSEVETKTNEKLYCFFYMLVTLAIDVVWVLYWESLWGSLKKDDESTIHFLVVLISWISIGLKVASTIMIGIGEWASIESSLPTKLKEQLNSNYKKQDDEP